MNRIYYGWVVIWVMFITLFVSLGLRFSFGVFYVAILDETGWQRADTAAIFSIAMAVYTSTILISGALFDRLGPRRLFPLAAVVLGAGIMLSSTMQSILELYLYFGVIVGIAFSLLGFPTHMAVVPRWFYHSKGLASAVALSGVGVGSLVLTNLSEYLITQIGWRDTYFIYGLVAIVVLVPLNAIFHRDSAQELGLPLDGRAKDARPHAATDAHGVTLGRAIRTPAFYVLLLAVTMIGFVSMTMVVHQTRLSIDLGYSFAVASGLFGFTGIMRSAGQMTWGPLSDRIGKRPIFVMVTLLGVAGVLLLFPAEQTPTFIILFVYALLFGFGYMGLSPVYAATVSDFFPGRHQGKILGLLDVGFGAGASSGPWLAGYLYDKYGHYHTVLWMVIAGVIITGAALYFVTYMRHPETD